MCIAEKCYFYETKQAGDIFLDLIDNKSCVLTTFLFFFFANDTYNYCESYNNYYTIPYTYRIIIRIISPVSQFYIS